MLFSQLRLYSAQTWNETSNVGVRGGLMLHREAKACWNLCFGVLPRAPSKAKPGGFHLQCKRAERVLAVVLAIVKYRSKKKTRCGSVMAAYAHLIFFTTEGRIPATHGTSLCRNEYSAQPVLSPLVALLYRRTGPPLLTSSARVATSCLVSFPAQPKMKPCQSHDTLTDIDISACQ